MRRPPTGPRIPMKQRVSHKVAALTIYVVSWIGFLWLLHWGWLGAVVSILGSLGLIMLLAKFNR
jgi:hypothetical protein